MPNASKSFRVTATIVDNLMTTYEQLGTGNALGLQLLQRWTIFLLSEVFQL